jgi:hypothetical protein
MTRALNGRDTLAQDSGNIHVTIAYFAPAKETRDNVNHMQKAKGAGREQGSLVVRIRIVGSPEIRSDTRDIQVAANDVCRG